MTSVVNNRIVQSIMREEILNLKNQAVAAIEDTQNLDELEIVRVDLFGRNGKLTSVIKRLGELKDNEKKEVGILINDSKITLLELINRKRQEMVEKVNGDRNSFDFTIPGIWPKVGHFHPQTIVLAEIKRIFSYLGYQVTDGPEIETDYYNFEALNIPKDHPARDTQQTFYLDTSGTNVNFGEAILRTQTSAMQGRVMSKMKPPFKVLAPGKNYRYEQVDASHGFEFWQCEGFVVDENIKLTDLFGTIDYVLRNIFGQNTKLKFATTNFPFVEPGVDTYIQCTVCGGTGCAFCKRTGWSEIMPAGMIHPNVLKEAGIDAKKWGGFAFAIGLSRVVTLKYHISDLRVLTTPDLKILKQF